MDSASGISLRRSCGATGPATYISRAETQLNSDAEWPKVAKDGSTASKPTRAATARAECYNWPLLSSDGPSDVWSTREVTLLLTHVLSLYGRSFCSHAMLSVILFGASCLRFSVCLWSSIAERDRGPSAEQMRVHRLTHNPFRSWCPQCVAGRAKIWPHFSQEASDHGGVQTICFDYCFLRDHPGGESVPVLVGREKKTKMMLALVVPFKGGGVAWLVRQVLRDLRKMGVRGKVVLKSDQEKPILDVLNDVCKQRGKESDLAVTLVESSPKG